MCRWSGSYSTAIGRGSPVESMCRTMLRIGAMPVSPARNMTGRLSPSGRRKSPYGPSTVTVAPASSLFSAAPPFPGPTRTQSCTARGRSGAEAIVYARETPSGKRKFTHWPGWKRNVSSAKAMVIWRTLGASSSISVTMAACDGISTPHAGLRQLLNLFQDAILLEAAQMIDEQHAVEMVDLVAERPGHQPLAPHLALLAVAVEVADLHALRPRHGLGEVGDRQTAFVLGDLPDPLDDLGVDEDVQLLGTLADGEVDDHEPPGDADLVRREADAGGGIHGDDHVVDQLLQRIVEVGHGRGEAPQDVVAEFSNWKNCHSLPLIFRSYARHPCL